MDKVEIWGKMVSAILKYNSTRISMRDKLNVLLEEENEILRKKVDLLFGNLKEYEEIIEDELLASSVDSAKMPKLVDPAKMPKLTANMLSQLFTDEITKSAIGDFENTFARDGATVERKKSDAMWIEKRQKAGDLLNQKCNDEQKESILSMALRNGETPDEFMKIVVSEFNRIPRTNNSKSFIKRADSSERPKTEEAGEQKLFEETLKRSIGVVSRSNSGKAEDDMPTVQEAVEACENIEKKFLNGVNSRNEEIEEDKN